MSTESVGWQQARINSYDKAISLRHRRYGHSSVRFAKSRQSASTSLQQFAIGATKIPIGLHFAELGIKYDFVGS
jgi:hypothetical protein